MNDPVFVWPRTPYQSYQHLHTLVELSGFPTCFIDEVDWGSNTTYICAPFNGEIPNPLPIRNCKFVWFQIERPSVHNAFKFGREDVDDLWICDVDWSKRVGGQFFLLASHPDLGFYEPQKRWDVATNCYETGRRGAIFSQLRNEFLFTPNSFNQPDIEFAASRCQLLPQQDDGDHSVTPLRFAIGAAYRMPLIYEADADIFPFTDGQDVLHVKYGELVDTTRRVLAGNFQHIGGNLHQQLCCETNFRKEVERML